MKGTMSNKRMLLLFGMPRSGTTWFGKLFDSHPDVIYLHEPDSEVVLKNVPLLLTREKYDQFEETVNHFCQNLLLKCSTRVNGKFPFFSKNYLSNIRNKIFQYNIFIAKVFEKISISIAILNPYKSLKADRPIVAWKSIESCGRVGLILNSVKDSTAIYIIRHPCGQIASVLNGENSGNFLDNKGSSEDYSLFEILINSDYAKSNKITLEKIKAMEPIQRLALRWVLFNDQAIQDIENLENRGIVIRYEDICHNTEKEIKNLFDFSNLSWNQQTEAFIKLSTKGNSNSYYSVFKNTDQSMTKWKKFLTEDQIETIKDTVRNSQSGKLFIDDF